MRGVSFAAVSIVSLLALGAPAQARPPADADADAKLGACPKHVRPQKLRCGTLTVPLERADPSLGTIPIRYAVRGRSRRHRPSQGAIFAVEGGPGYGSIGSSRYYIHLFGHLLDRRELVLVDMRGTGHSRAIDCPKLQRGRGSDRGGVAQCASLLGRDYASFRTSAAADDIDSVRSALGFDRIDLYGDSYGTFLAQSYAFRHGDALRSLVLDSAYPVRGESAWYPSLWRTGIRSLRIACERSPRCHGDPAARLRRAVALLRRTPRGVGPLLDAIASSGYEPPLRSYLEIDRAVSRYLGGNRGPYKRLTDPGSSGYGNPRFYSRGDELAVSCNDYPMLWDKESGAAARRRELRAAVAAYPKRRFAPFTPREVALSASAGYLECLAWPRPSALYEPPAPPGAPPPAMPTLVISGELDDVTSPTEGRMVADDFADSRFMVVRNGGHVSSLYGGRYPSRDRVREFLRRHG
ncbi:MAG: alpha/beta hydrolase [Vicinamibacteria bacterium]|jgi:pimeloyl-ACP methyl ester carboxylesterase